MAINRGTRRGNIFGVLGGCLLGFVTIIGSCLVISFANAPREQPGFCITPNTVAIADVVGTWSARYENHWVNDGVRDVPIHMTGVETITFSADGSYTHFFVSDKVLYESSPELWSLDMTALDAPRLRMENMRFFAAGEIIDEKNETLRLSPEKIDLLNFQGHSNGLDRVNYPTDGFVYLYVRKCSRELILHQMMFNSSWDPDAMSFDSPFFHNDRHKVLFGCFIPFRWCLET